MTEKKRRKVLITGSGGAARTACCKGFGLARFYQRKGWQGGWAEMVVTVARKLAFSVWHVLNGDRAQGLRIPSVSGVDCGGAGSPAPASLPGGG
jgi:hypothetical protein